MRPNYVVIALDVRDKLILSGLYYNERKAKKAFDALQKPSSDGYYTILREDGGSESIAGSNLTIKLRYLGDHISTTRAHWKKSFFDTTQEEFNELSIERDIPIEILKKIAAYELDFIEDRGNTRWNARKRCYLPRWLSEWL